MAKVTKAKEVSDVSKGGFKKKKPNVKYRNSFKKAGNVGVDYNGLMLNKLDTALFSRFEALTPAVVKMYEDIEKKRKDKEKQEVKKK